MNNKKSTKFYSLFVRFDSYDNMVASGVQTWFQDNIVSSLFAYNAAATPPPTKTSIGDRNAIYIEQADIVNFLGFTS